MAKLIKYGMLSTDNNSLAGYLVKAQCDFCGARYGSVEEARKCEQKHLQTMISNLSVFRGNKK